MGTAAIEVAVQLTNKTTAAIGLPSFGDRRNVLAFSDLAMVRTEVRLSL